MKQAAGRQAGRKYTKDGNGWGDVGETGDRQREMANPVTHHLVLSHTFSSERTDCCATCAFVSSTWCSTHSSRYMGDFSINIIVSMCVCVCV